MAGRAETLSNPKHNAVSIDTTAPVGSQRRSPWRTRFVKSGIWLTTSGLIFLSSGCTSASDQTSAEPTTNVTLSPTTTQSVPSTTLIGDASPVAVPLGDLGWAPTAPFSLNYLAQTEQHWSVELGKVTSLNLNEEFELVGTSIGVTIEAEFVYEGESAAGKLLDLVIELETPTGLVDAVQDACAPRPRDNIDLFASVPADESKSGLLCFQTEQRPTALIITPLLGGAVRIELEGS